MDKVVRVWPHGHPRPQVAVNINWERSGVNQCEGVSQRSDQIWDVDAEADAGGYADFGHDKVLGVIILSTNHVSNAEVI